MELHKYIMPVALVAGLAYCATIPENIKNDEDNLMNDTISNIREVNSATESAINQML